MLIARKATSVPSSWSLTTSEKFQLIVHQYPAFLFPYPPPAFPRCFTAILEHSHLFPWEWLELESESGAVRERPLDHSGRAEKVILKSGYSGTSLPHYFCTAQVW